MKILSTLTFLALATQCTLAAAERNLLRTGYGSPINFSDLSDLEDTTMDATTQKQGTGAAVPSLDSITKGGILPSTDVGDNIIPTDLTTITGRSGLQSLTSGSGLNTITNGIGKSDKLPSLPIGGGTSGADATKGVSGLTDGLGLPLKSSPSTGGKTQLYKSGTYDKSDVLSEDRKLKSPKFTPPPATNPSTKKTTKKTKKHPKKNSKKTPKTDPKGSHTPNVKPAPKPDPEKNPVQGPV